MNAKQLALTLLTVIGLLGVAPRLQATDYPTYADGFVEGLYTHKGGLWYNAAGVAHSRHKDYYTEGGGYTRSACGYGCGYTYAYTAPQQYFRWVYVAVQSPATYVAPALPSYTDAGWRGKLLDIARERDKTELAIRKETVEQAAYLDSLRALGFNFSIQGYGQALNYPNLASYAGAYAGHYASPALGTYGTSGQTQYGFSFQQLQSAYGATDLNALYQASARLTQGAQASATQANTEFGGLVGQAGDNAARVAQALAKAAEIQAQGAAAERALNAAKAAASTTTITTGQGIGAGTGAQQQTTGQVPPNPPAMPQIQDGNGNPQANAVPAGDFLRTVGLPLCGSCHGQGAKNQATFDITTYPGLPRERKAAVWARLVTSEDARSMPRAASGGPGTPLTLAQLDAFFRN